MPRRMNRMQGGAKNGINILDVKGEGRRVKNVVNVKDEGGRKRVKNAVKVDADRFY
jgi:hypothetical protein